MSSHMQVVNSWVRGVKAKGYAMSTDGQNLLSWDKIIGRTLSDDTKQVLDLRGVYNVSSSTAKHVTYALRGVGVQSIEPKTAPESLLYSKYVDFKFSWTYLDFPALYGMYHVRLTKKVWKTLNGAKKAAKILGGIVFPLDDAKTFSVFKLIHTIDGKVVYDNI